MNYNVFRDFEQVCFEQKVALDDRLIYAAAIGSTTKGSCYTPSDILVAIAEAGHLLRKDPDAELCGKPVELPDGLGNDVAASCLARIINASLDPAKPDDLDSYFVCNRAQSIDTCSSAEIGFIDTIDAFEYPVKELVPVGFQIIVAGDKPLFIRKSVGEPSALSLEETMVNGIPYPAGSLFRIDLTKDLQFDDFDGHFYPGKPYIEPREKEIIMAETIAKIAFMRLSVLALPPMQRSEFEYFIEYHPLGSDSMPTSYTVDHLRKSLLSEIKRQQTSNNMSENCL